jgi:hypothetical protein
LTGVEENRFLREGDVNAGLIDFRERGHGAFELAFERAAIVDLFGEVARAQIRSVEKLESDSACSGESRARQSEPCVRQTAGRNLDGRAGFVELEFDSRFADFLGNGGGVFRRESAVQHAEIAVMLPSQKTENDGTRNHGDQDQ